MLLINISADLISQLLGVSMYILEVHVPLFWLNNRLPDVIVKIKKLNYVMSCLNYKMFSH
jgi:hypothetical protein